jgi:hypothetical protein
VLLRSSGEAREAARDYLIGIVRDTSLEPGDRLDAYGRVRAWAAPGTFTGVAIGARVLE